jgi:hypothetical protein
MGNGQQQELENIISDVFKCYLHLFIMPANGSELGYLNFLHGTRSSLNY